jgi:hypothetical protein
LLAERKKLVERALVDRVPSGWRRAELADVARELSPTYDRLIRHSNHLAGEIGKAEKAANQARLFVARAEGTIEDRERDMTALRKLATASGFGSTLSSPRANAIIARPAQAANQARRDDRTEKCRRPPPGNGAERCAGGRRARNGRQAGAGGSSAGGIERD